MVLAKSLESPLDSKEIQPVRPKGDQSSVIIWRTGAEAEIPILWPPDVKSWLVWKDPDAGKDWSWEKKRTTEDEMAGWHHWLDGCESGWTPGVGDGQGGLECYSPWGHKESDIAERLNWTELKARRRKEYKQIRKKKSNISLLIDDKTIYLENLSNLQIKVSEINKWV